MIYEASPFAIGLFIAFVLAVLAISSYFAKKTQSSKGYYAAGGTIHWGVNGIAFAGDYLSAASFLGICGMIAFDGYDGFLYSIGYLAGWVVALFVVAEPLKRFGKYTFTDALDYKFGSKGIQLTAAISTLIVSLCYLVPQMVGAGVLIEPLLGFPHWVGVVLVGAIVIIIVALLTAFAYLTYVERKVQARIQVRQAEASLLREAGDLAGAYAVLEQGLAEFPDAPDLLYDVAMLAEKLDRLDVAEARLRRLIELKPDDPQALNALGYTLVDRTARIEEGRALIEKALKLSPDDPFILDSMGWAMFKLGRYDDAVVYLGRAYAGRPDAEIAAHLGEVLWVKGERDRAKEIWAAQLKDAPDHPVLLETMRRLSR